MKSLSGVQKRPPSNQPIKFGDKYYSKPSSMASRFNHQYTNIRQHSSSKEARKINRILKKTHILDKDFKPFAPDDVIAAIKRSKSSTAVGPDGMSMLHLKHMGPLAISYLTTLFNLSVSRADLPSIWKFSLVIPVLKPAKDPSLGPSYRPISLLCPASKVLERLLLPYVNAGIQPDASQHGFRARRSPTSALLPLVQEIASGFNERKPPKRTVLAAVDLSRAFDSVNHDILRSKLIASQIHSNVVRWLSCWLKGRHQAVIYQGKRSRFKQNRLGVPQGAVLSPTLFNLYVAEFPVFDSEKTSFADDFSVFASAVDITELEVQISRDLEKVQDWASGLKLDISAPKSSITLFSPSTHEYRYHPQVTMNGSIVPLNKNPKILGVTLDPLFTFSPHVKEIVKSATQRLKVMKALAGTSWGKDTETLLLTYKMLIRTKIDYATPVWLPNLKPSSLVRLQRIQNNALRIATGCHLKSSWQHLHNEAKILSVGEHSRMLASQYLASALNLSHPSHPVVSRPHGLRNMKKTLKSSFSDAVNPHLVDGVVPDGNVGVAQNQIHTLAVTNSIATSTANPLLGTPPPPVHVSELALPRQCRAILAQLRSSQCSQLRDYQFKIGKSPSPSCPDCGNYDQDVPHLFECDENHTTLTVADLWHHPKRVARFLSSLPSFSHLPNLLPPRQRPPPEPPP